MESTQAQQSLHITTLVEVPIEVERIVEVLIERVVERINSIRLLDETVI